jgi:LPS-assembly lipoprotein
MNRRPLLTASLAALVLSACGFKLRNSQVFVFQTIAVTPELRSPVAAELVRYLGDSVRPVASAPGAPVPDVVFEMLNEAREKTVVGVNASGQVREFQLSIRVVFKLRTAQGKVLIAPTEISQQRDIGFSESAALAKEAEEALLYRDMQADIVQQLLRRLAAVKSIKP